MLSVGMVQVTFFSVLLARMDHIFIRELAILIVLLVLIQLKHPLMFVLLVLLTASTALLPDVLNVPVDLLCQMVNVLRHVLKVTSSQQLEEYQLASLVVPIVRLVHQQLSVQVAVNLMP